MPQGSIDRALKPVRDAAQDRQIDRDPVHELRPLYFNRHLLPCVKPRPIDLPETGRGHRNRIKAGKQGLRAGSQLLGNERAGMFGRKGRHGILQTC